MDLRAVVGGTDLGVATSPFGAPWRRIRGRMTQGWAKPSATVSTTSVAPVKNLIMAGSLRCRGRSKSRTIRRVCKWSSSCRGSPRGMTVAQSKQPKRPGSFAQRKVQDALNHPAVHVPCFCLFPRSNARSLEVQVVACNWGAQRSVHFARQMERSGWSCGMCRWRLETGQPELCQLGTGRWTNVPP